MPASLGISLRSLSRKPRLSRTKWFVENEEFELSGFIVNDDSQPFPPSDMWIEFKVLYPAGQTNRVTFNLAKGLLLAGESFSVPGKWKALSPGFALLYVDYRPYGQGNVLHASGGDEINPASGDAMDGFHVVSRMEIHTLRGLYVAALAAILSGLGLLITALR